ncbi:MAG: DUF1929 domain-containing protein [Ignavibacteriae bacterium]|nr:DUF1929 domain-containing protein [Ignavibacteriota bacterium]
MHQAPETQTKPSDSAIRHRLAMMWFANSYPQYIREDATVSSSTSVPAEYLSPYPNPWYWPKNNPQTKQVQKTESRPTALEAVRATSAVQLKNDPIIYPSWLEFWEGKVPEYPLPVIPNVIIPDIPPSKFMEVFRETQGLRLPFLKVADAEVKQTEKGNISTVEGLIAIRGADYRVTWEAVSESETKRKDEKNVRDYLKDMKFKDNPNLYKYFDAIGTIGVSGFTGKKDNDPKDDDPKDDDPKDDDDIKNDDDKKKEDGTKKEDNKIDYNFHWSWEDGTHNWNLGGEDIPVGPPERKETLTWENENYYEEICCAGLNPDDGFLEAVIIVKQEEGYSGGLCWPGSFESVGFWLNEPNDTELEWNWWNPPGQIASRYDRIWVGEARVNVHDIPRYIYPVDDPDSWLKTVGYLHYTVRVELNDTAKKFIRKCYEKARLPRLICMLTWNRVVNNNDFYRLLSPGWRDIKEFDVQFPILGAWVESLGQKKHTKPEDYYFDSQMFPIHVAALPDGTVVIFRHEWRGPYPTWDDYIYNPYNITKYQDIIKYEDALAKAKTGIFNQDVAHDGCKIYRPFWYNKNTKDVGITNIFEPLMSPKRRPNNVIDSAVKDNFMINIYVDLNGSQSQPSYSERLISSDILTNLKKEILANNNSTVYKFKSLNPQGQLTEFIYTTIEEKIRLYVLLSQKLDHEDFEYYPTFCSGQSVLYDGNVIVMGGTLGRGGHAILGADANQFHDAHDIGIDESVMLDWVNKTWKYGPDMKNGRWYPSALAMPDKGVLIVDGHPGDLYPYHSNVDIDFYNPETNGMITLPYTGIVWSPFEGVAVFDGISGKPKLNSEMRGEYSRIFLLPDGSVFSATSLYSFYDPTPESRDYIQKDPTYDYKNIRNPARGLWNELRISYANYFPHEPGEPDETQQQYEERTNKRWLTTSWVKNNDGTTYSQVYSPWTMRYVPQYNNLGVPIAGHWEKVCDSVFGRGSYNESTGVLLPLKAGSNWEPTILMVEHLTVWICKPLEYIVEREPGHWDFSLRAWKFLIPQRLEEFRYKSRVNGAMIILADGTILFVGGTNAGIFGQPDGLKGSPVNEDLPHYDNNLVTIAPYDFNSLLASEIYDPYADSGKGKWLKGAEINEVRGYHSSYILLFDGSVLIGGGQPIPGNYPFLRPDLYPDPYPDDGFPHQGFVRNFERYYPGYCSKPRPRIEIIDGDDYSYKANDIIKVRYMDEQSKNLQIERVGFVRLSSMTHGFVNDQRYVEMKYNEVENGIDIKIPQSFGSHNYTSKNILPPGPYYIFIMFKNGWVSQMQPWEKQQGNDIIPVFSIFIDNK